MGFTVGKKRRLLKTRLMRPTFKSRIFSRFQVRTKREIVATSLKDISNLGSTFSSLFWLERLILEQQIS